jgi:hypothetical protein
VEKMGYINRDYGWPYNLAYDVLGGDQEFKAVLPYYLEGTAKANLSERECRVIYLRYCHNKTYDEIGKEFRLTKARIMQIWKKAIKKLRRLENRYMGVRRCDYNEVVQENASLALQMKQANDCAELSDYEKLKNEVTVRIKVDAFLDTPIKDLGLSVRAYNRLAGSRKFATYGDFQNFKIADLFKIRGVGRKVMSEILDKLDAIGFKACSGDHILDLAEWFTNREEHPDAVFVWKGESQQ